nr:hypothetical protein [Tanacetum cinerariifolium]
MSLASSAVTYTSVYTNSEPGRVFWGTDEELSDGEPIHPEYIPLEDEHILSAEEQPLPPVVLPTAESPGYVAELDPEEDPEEYEDDETEDGGRGGEEEDEQLAPADSIVAIPTDELVSPPKGTEHVIPPPFTDTATTGTRITIRLQTAISFPSEAKVERLLAMPTPSPSPLASLSPRSVGEPDEELSDGGSPRVIVYEYDGLPMLPVAPPSSDYVPGPEEPQTPPTPQDEDEHEPMFIQPHDLDFPLPPVVSPTVESPEYVAESNPEEDPEEYGNDEIEDGPVDYPMDERDDGDDDDGDSSGDNADDGDEEEEEHLAPADSAVVIPTDELVSPPEGTEPVIPPPSTDTATIGARITIMEDEAYAAREAWAHSIGLSQAVRSELQTHQEQVYAHEFQLQTHQTQLQLQ